jgi:CheY-like chemotaxis protein
MATDKPAAELLLVEDNPADACLVREAVSAWTIPHRLHVAPDGERALALLRGGDGNLQGLRPALILLDLNLPGKSGLEVLSEIKNDPKLMSVPVIVLTSSTHEDDIREVYERGGNSFLVKPRDLDELMELARAVERYWFEFAKLPKNVN